MAGDENWVDIGSPEELSGPPLRRIKAGNCELAISLKDGKFGAGSITCNHAGTNLAKKRHYFCSFAGTTAMHQGETAMAAKKLERLRE
jgi:hypothetical protein